MRGRLLHADPRQVTARRENGLIIAAAQRHQLGAGTRIPFVCECDDPLCSELVRITAADYYTARDAGEFLTAPGHRVRDAHVRRTGATYSVWSKTSSTLA